MPQLITIDQLKVTLHKDYMKQVENFLGGDEKRAMRFMSAVVYAVQKNPRLLECTPTSVVQSFMSCAEYDLMPSSVSGESYVIPYENSKKQPDGNYLKVMEAQFQLGYQGLVTLFMRAGVRNITADIVRENDDFTMLNSEITHTIDHKMSNAGRGARIGAYVIITQQSGDKSYKYMHKDDILAHAKRFSKSFSSKYSPWNESNDPEGWMWKKTVLVQCGKLVSKNETVQNAIALDYRDSKINDRLKAAQDESGDLTIGALTNPDEITYDENYEQNQAKS